MIKRREPITPQYPLIKCRWCDNELTEDYFTDRHGFVHILCVFCRDILDNMDKSHYEKCAWCGEYWPSDQFEDCIAPCPICSERLVQCPWCLGLSEPEDFEDPNDPDRECKWCLDEDHKRKDRLDYLAYIDHQANTWHGEGWPGGLTFEAKRLIIEKENAS